jgi:8-oxo-dGTP diphosphatase
MNDRAQGFALGALCAVAGCWVYKTYFLESHYVVNVKEVEKGLADDDCNSLFYDTVPGQDGAGFPKIRTTSAETMTRLKTVQSEWARLPFDFYKRAVETLPIVCVDVICKRADGKILLFYRRDAPAANLWWWPGGRLYRGETFFETAVRKVRDETGNKLATVYPVGLVNVWNTFFPDSHWDAERSPGREGTQTINVTVVVELVEDLQVHEDADADWAVEASRWVSAVEALQPGKYDKYVTSNVKLALERGFLTL